MPCAPRPPLAEAEAEALAPERAPPKSRTDDLVGGVSAPESGRFATFPVLGRAFGGKSCGALLAGAGTIGVVLQTLEAYYDAAPRPLATTEEVGPFTLFLRRDPAGWPYYARPRLGLTDVISAGDVERVRLRQRQLEAPEAIEWVHENTPGLLQTARASGLSVEECPLLTLDGRMAAPPTGPGVTIRVMDADDDALGAVCAAVHAGFGGTDDVGEPDAGTRPEQMRRGLLRTVGAFLDGTPVGGGSHGPRGDATELAGIAVLPHARRRGIGAAVTAALAADARARGIRTVFLSAQDEDVARVYERVGFRRVGTACVAEPA